MTKQKVVVDQQARDKITNDLATNFLVEAGAGSGKTTSLVERMVNLIKTGTSQIHEIVAITFTRKAADELKTRFQIQLEKNWRIETDQNIKKRLENALQHIERCFINTVHSFCAKLLRERPVEAQLDLTFSELEEVDDQKLINEVWQAYILDIQESSPNLLKEFDELGISIELVQSSFQEMKEYPDVTWITEHVDKPEIFPVYNKLSMFVKEAFKAIPKEEPAKGYDDLQKLILSTVRKEKYLDTAKEKEIIQILESFNKKHGVTQYKWTDKEDAKFYRDQCNDLVEKIIQPTLLAWKEFCHPKIITFLKGALTKYEQIKQERSLLNFQDLLMKTAELLKGNDEVRSYFQKKYRFLLVDEFQDTDPIQAEIMFFLTGENVDEKDWTLCKPRPGSLFVVGDPKQAIYRFRRADIDTYNRVKELIKLHGGDILQLTMNFRTVDTITTKLNHVFSQYLPETESNYQASFHPLNAFKDDLESSFSGIKMMSVPEEYSKKEEVVEKDAENIALAIQQLIEEGKSPKDFMILTRYNDGVAIYARTMEEYGIPVNVGGEMIIGETKEFSEILRVLQVFVDPTDSISLVAALRGSFFGISDDELYQWKRAGGRFSIYSEIPDELDDQQKIKFADAFQKLKAYQKWIHTNSPTTAIEKILENVGFYPLLLANERGKRELKSLIQIIEALRTQEANGVTAYSDIFQLLKEKVMEKTTVANIEEEANAVRIMNVHKAKGLEAPIVFLAHPMKKTEPEKFINKHIKREKDQSKGYFTFTVQNGWQSKEIARPLEWETHKQEELCYLTEEETRIIYVAATRAEEAMIISSSAKNNNKNPWSILLDHIEGLEEFLLPEQIKPIVKAKVPLDYHEFLSQIEVVGNWVERSSKKTYDVWSPTDDKNYEEVLTLSREEGGGKEWGTIIHHVFDKLVNGQNVNHLIPHLLNEYGMDAGRSTDIWNAIKTFQQSTIWNELQTAQTVITEVPFTCQIDQTNSLYRFVDKSEDRKEPVIVKGVIDLIYKTEAGWKIVDYKTDKVKDKEEIEILKKFYQDQVQFYKDAWEEMTGEAVVGSELYFV